MSSRTSINLGRGWIRRRRRREGQIVLRVHGWRIRFYAGTSYASRPRVHHWKVDGHEGIALRRSRGVGGRDGQRVFGVQWRRLDG